MKHKCFTMICLTLTGCFVLASCDNAAEKKARESGREKIKAQEEAAKRMLQRNAGDYTPAEIDTSMAPKPVETPNSVNGLNPKREDH